MEQPSTSTLTHSTKASIPGIITVYIAIFLLPIEFSFSIGPVFITPTRLFFIVTIIPLLICMLKNEKLILADYIILTYVAWTSISFFAKRGAGGLEPAGQHFLEVTVPYLIARLFIKSPNQLQKILVVLGVIVLVLGLLAIPEAVLKERFLHDIPRMLTGVRYDIQSDERFGLLRAASTFENPILFGVFASTFMSLIWYSGVSIRLRAALVIGIVISTIFSLSSVAYLLLVLQICIIVTETATRSVSFRAPAILMLISACVITVEAISDRGVAGLVAAYLTFNPHTAYARIQQWDYSIDDIRANPLFGINFEDWTRPFWLNDSIDNHWLFLAMTSGLPAVVFVGLLLSVLSYRVYNRRKIVQDPLLKSLMLGWVILLAALFLGGWTVTFFGKMLPSMFFIVGIGAALTVMPHDDIGPAETTSSDITHRVVQHLSFTRFATTHKIQILSRYDPGLASLARPLTSKSDGRPGLRHSRPTEER
jgi:hypothetical protein